MLQLVPLRDVAFGEDDVLRRGDVFGRFGRQAQVGDDAFGAVGGGEPGEGETDAWRDGKLRVRERLGCVLDWFRVEGGREAACDGLCSTWTAFANPLITLARQ